MTFEEQLASIRRGPDECWIWTWAKTKGGYGHFRRKKIDQYAHRAAYELLVGPIPPGVELDHFRCNVRACCNPAHLLPQPTKKAHVQRHISERTHCVHGHQLLPVTPDTWRTNPDGSRLCNACYKARNALRWKPEEAAKFRVYKSRQHSTKLDIEE